MQTRSTAHYDFRSTVRVDRWVPSIAWTLGILPCGEGAHHLPGGAAVHVVAAVAPAPVVVGDPGLGGGVELGEGVDAGTVEVRSVELGEHAALEPFADRVVVRAARRDPQMGQLQLG